ncbi:MAG: hypothetical protein AMJ53_17075 [Gammaproteobacteria bacterium SG8_11]|nr:MAG: hypothetical protein AMJ53_17075 [Gammaproteobacteria bacterium SG8_11]
MNEHDVNVVTYNDLIDANLIPFPLKARIGGDYSTFEVNSADTNVEINIPYGNSISIEFSPLIE